MTTKVRGVFERPAGSGDWWIRFADAAGKIRYEKAGTKRSAVTLYMKRKGEVLAHRKLPETLRRAVIPFSEIAKDALEYSRAYKGPYSYKADCWHMKIISAWFGDRAADDVGAQDLEHRLEELREAGRKGSTQNRYRALLSLVYRLAVRNGKASANPARLVPLRKENNARIRFLDADEEKALRGKIRRLYPEREPEFDLALQTGMRRGEQYGLRWENVNLGLALLTIPRSKHGERRHVPLNSAALRALGLLQGRDAEPGYVCLGPLDRRAARDWSRWFEQCVEAAELHNFRWHDLRHTFASRLVMSGVDLRTVQELMGHKTIAVTVRYSHLSPRHLHDAVEVLASFGKPTETTTETRPAEVSRGPHAKRIQLQ